MKCGELNPWHLGLEEASLLPTYWLSKFDCFILFPSVERVWIVHFLAVFCCFVFKSSVQVCLESIIFKPNCFVPVRFLWSKKNPLNTFFKFFHFFIVIRSARVWVRHFWCLQNFRVTPSIAILKYLAYFKMSSNTNGTASVVDDVKMSCMIACCIFSNSKLLLLIKLSFIRDGDYHLTMVYTSDWA